MAPKQEAAGAGRGLWQNLHVILKCFERFKQQDQEARERFEIPEQFFAFSVPRSAPGLFFHGIYFQLNPFRKGDRAETQLFSGF